MGYQNRENRDFLMVLALYLRKTIPILPTSLRVKYQNHERIPILLVYVLIG